jgi:2-dehydro-3-deoxy-D-arabinonate dehydratase
MKLFRTHWGIFCESQAQFFLLPDQHWDALVNRPALHTYLLSATENLPEVHFFDEKSLLAPLLSQEVWLAATELAQPIAKISPARVRGPEQGLRLRPGTATHWAMPRVVVFFNTAGQLAGYTLAHDVLAEVGQKQPWMLSRAYSYDGSLALGPCLYVPENPQKWAVNFQLYRKGQLVHQLSVTFPMAYEAAQVASLFSEMRFAQGVYLLLTAGIDWLLDLRVQEDDWIRSETDFGALENWVTY